MKSCNAIRSQFSSYLDGAMTGVTMQQVAAHLESCAACSREFASWRNMQQVLTDLGPAKAPADLALRLRVAISQEQQRTTKQSLARWQVRWSNTFAPFLLRASAGFASAVLLIGSVALLIGAFAAPEPVEARDEPAGAATSPRFLYSMNESNAPELGVDHAGDVKNVGEAKVTVSDDSDSVIVEAYVNDEGRVYDYHIISGPHDAAARARIENLLLFSIFEPARVFGEPVRGVALVSFSGIAVQG
ncbi:zf-HC2 domain-containing protein [Silvibacterium acidisoli]|uniref:zf-HC2 domain-containing protein n=1 Tax=Acidobacteriaceae bacterium ZG23-2 TaxID=2883246 RepID=UPI00406C78AF